MITINHLKKQFGDTVACNIEEFTINDGDILGLVGNNGAGKTTLFRLLLDLLKADEGMVCINNINPAESEEWKQQVGAYIDEGFLIDFLTPEEYFAFLGKISGMTQQQVDERLKDFEQFAAGEVFGQKKLIRNLSAGNKQKVGIISALFRRPQTVILDEPFNFLDPSSQLILKHVLTDYAHETGATLIISSHNLQHTVDISNRIALLEHGVIIRDLPNQEASAAAELEEYFGGKE
ncbi:MAG: ABC transporter ATP-binding protein [Prevotella sp.]|jgi:ABC-2 type transport system ATP-binding protein|nr:ABC transporter ATP-binding protein [Prevotella sp.]